MCRCISWSAEAAQFPCARNVSRLTARGWMSHVASRPASSPCCPWTFSLQGRSRCMRSRSPLTGEPGVTGYVLAPDGTPVSGGIVGIGSRAGRETTSIGRTGRFRLVPDAPGDHELVVSASGLAAYRVRITVPPSRTLRLPVIRLSPATYFRVRFVSTSGEPITSPRVRRMSVDLSGMPIWEPRDGSRDDQIDSDGTMTIGPLPRGVTMLALDMPLLAQTRLPDVHVTGDAPLLDAGTVMVEPGALVHVDVVDITGAPVPEHLVFIEDALPLSPLGVPPVRTNQQGRATFNRLGAGRYRVHTRSTERCGNGLPLSTGRVVRCLARALCMLASSLADMRRSDSPRRSGHCAEPRFRRHPIPVRRHPPSGCANQWPHRLLRVRCGLSRLRRSATAPPTAMVA